MSRPTSAIPFPLAIDFRVTKGCIHMTSPPFGRRGGPTGARGGRASARHNDSMETQVRPSDELEAWLKSDSPKTLGSLTHMFGEKSFAVVFLFLLGLPALPLPTGGATHVLEVIA